MPARDAYHANLINALVKDNWSITDDPYIIRWGSRYMYNKLENAVGQYIVYHDVLEKTNPERTLYLAVDVKPYDGIFSEPIGQLMVENQRLNLVVFNKSEEVILKWIPSLNINK